MIIIGGGLAGLAAAVRLARLGARPVVLEKRPFLGGRAFSFTDPETGVEVDNGQHVFVGACTEFIGFLKETGAWSDVRMPSRLNADVQLNGMVAPLRGAQAIPGPLANVPAVLAYAHLSMRDRLRVLFGLARVKSERLLPGGPLDAETFQSWLKRHGQSEAAIACFWELIILPGLNDSVSAVSASAGLMLFQTALFGDPRNAAIGFPVVGLTRLMSAPSRAAIEKAGGEVRTGVEAMQVECQDGRVTGVRTANGDTLRASAYVSATPPWSLGSLLPQDLAGHPFFAPAARIESSPIVGVHIWYDATVMDQAYLAVLESPVQWVFNVDRLHGPAAGAPTSDAAPPSQHIVISLSGAWQWKDMSKAELRETFVSEMARVLPRAARANVTRFLAVKMLDATFRATPGTVALRLPQKTPVEGLFLAGDWTITGWPSTMESAVRSGNLAAAAVMRHLSAEGT